MKLNTPTEPYHCSYCKFYDRKLRTCWCMDAPSYNLKITAPFKWMCNYRKVRKRVRGKYPIRQIMVI